MLPNQAVAGTCLSERLTPVALPDTRPNTIFDLNFHVRRIGTAERLMYCINVLFRRSKQGIFIMYYSSRLVFDINLSCTMDNAARMRLVDFVVIPSLLLLPLIILA